MAHTFQFFSVAVGLTGRAHNLLSYWLWPFFSRAPTCATTVPPVTFPNDNAFLETARGGKFSKFLFFY